MLAFVVLDATQIKHITVHVKFFLLRNEILKCLSVSWVANQLSNFVLKQLLLSLFRHSQTPRPVFNQLRFFVQLATSLLQEGLSGGGIVEFCEKALKRHH